jgi:hypothetical protein
VKTLIQIVGGIAVALWLVLTAAFAEEPVKRRILGMFDGSREADAAVTRIHRFAELPLAHLGYVVEYHDVREPLPPVETMADFAGVVSWFDAPMAAGERYLVWAAHVANAGTPFAVLGDPGVAVTPRTLLALNLFLAPLGLRHTGLVVAPARGSRVGTIDRTLVGFECEPDPMLPDYAVMETLADDIRLGLEIVAPPLLAKRAVPVVAVSRRGGYAALNYEFCHANAKYEVGRWLIDPFAFFSTVFDDGVVPRPDVSTVSGRRAFVARIGGEGWSASSEVERYRSAKALAGAVVLDELVRPFPDLPATIDVSEADLAGRSTRIEEAKTIRDEAIALGIAMAPGRRVVTSGASRFDWRAPSISGLHTLTEPDGRRAVVLPASDERPDAGGRRPQVGFEGLIETYTRTDVPRRLLPVLLNYRAHAGRDPALLRGMRGVLSELQRKSLAPLALSTYAAAVDGFATTEIVKVEATTWRVSRRGASQTVRFDTAADIMVDLRRSVGVIGSTRHGTSLYVTLDPDVEDALIALSPVLSEPEPTPRLSLVDSRWQLAGLVREPCGATLRAQGFGLGEFVWEGAEPRRWQIAVSRSGRLVEGRTVEASPGGRLAFTLQTSGVDGVTLTMRCMTEAG